MVASHFLHTFIVVQDKPFTANVEADTLYRVSVINAETACYMMENFAQHKPKMRTFVQDMTRKTNNKRKYYEPGGSGGAALSISNYTGGIRGIRWSYLAQ